MLFASGRGMPKIATEILSPDAVYRAAAILRDGGLLAFPTETVWGLGANAFDVVACRRIFQAKGRPQDNPLIVHVADADGLMAATTQLGPEEEALIARFMPGPLTLVVPRGARIHPEVTGGRPDVGVRMPRLAIARELLALAGVPVAAPSANRSGRPSPTTFEMATAAMQGRAEGILEGPPCEVGLESTVARVHCGEIHILRPGAITAEELWRAVPHLRPIIAYSEPIAGAPRAPGLKYAHYRPRARVIAAETVPELLTAARAVAAQGALAVLWQAAELSPSVVAELPVGTALHPYDSLPSYAQHLFAWFHALDEANVATIIAHLPVNDGLGRALRNRISKAAEPIAALP